MGVSGSLQMNLSEESHVEPFPEVEEEVVKPNRKRARRQSSERPQKRRRIAAVPLPKLLSSLHRSQLEQTVLQIVEKNPDFESVVRANIPDFDWMEALAHLDRLYEKICGTLSSQETDRMDGRAFRRVRPAQAEFIRVMKEQLQSLVASKQWSALYHYLNGAFAHAECLPTWKQEAHMKPKMSLFKALAKATTRLLTQKGKSLSGEEKETLLMLCTEHNKPEYQCPFVECLAILADGELVLPSREETME